MPPSVAILVGEGEAGAERHLAADDAVPAIEADRAGEHVHRAALALGIAGDAPGEFGHDAARVHVANQHVAMIAVAGDHAVARLQRVLDADRHGLLADVEVAEAADQAHAIELAGLLLEAADQEHLAVVAHELLAARAAGLARGRLGRLGRRPGCHRVSLLPGPPARGQGRLWPLLGQRADVYTVSHGHHSRRSLRLRVP